MKTIASFTVNHDTLEKGMYVSRVDGDVVTYDIRMKKPNAGDYLSDGAMHTLNTCLPHTPATASGRTAFSTWGRWAAARAFTCCSRESSSRRTSCACCGR